MTRWRFHFLAVTIAALASGIALWPQLAYCQASVREGFEGPETSWRDGGGDARYKIESHARVKEGVHSGNWCERLRIGGDNGTSVYISHEIGQARVIDELAPSLWLKSDRSGLQLLARVVLPRSIDSKTGKPRTLLIRGPGYTQAGTWQQLRLENVAQLVERQAQVLRSQVGPKVDTGEAYLDRLVLNVYGGPGVTNVWIDDLEVAGQIGPRSITAAAERPRLDAAEPANANAANQPSAQRLPPTWSGSSAAAEPASPGANVAVRLSGSILSVDGKPFFLRAIEYRGEPLALLQGLGFNAVKLTGPPTPQLLAEARRLDLWLIAQPPLLEEFSSAGTTSGYLLGPQFDRVLAWNLGENLSARELDYVRNWVKQLHTADPLKRPILCDADSDLRAYSRQADVMLTHRSPLGTSLELPAYGQWLRERPQLAIPGKPFWTTIQTQPAPRLVEQTGALLAGRTIPQNWQDEQLRLLASTALTSGMRGFCFASHTPLDAPGADTELRAAMLELLNLELELIEPWTAGGTFLTTASSGDTQVQGAVIQTDRARLLLPMPTAPHSQIVVGGAPSGLISLVVPGVPESNDAYELTAAGLRPLAHKRVAGGIRVALGEGQRLSMVVLTQDPLVISSLSKRIVKVRNRASQLHRQIAARSLVACEEMQRGLDTLGTELPATRALVVKARAQLADCDSAIGRGDLQTAVSLARRSLDAQYQAQRLSWEKAIGKSDSVVTTPLGVQMGSLPDHMRWMQRISTETATRGSLLAGGEFEDLPRLMQAGWRHFQHSQTGISTSVDLSPDAPHGGQFALRLKAWAPNPADAPYVVESSPLWVTSAAVPVAAGQAVMIEGWVKMPQRLTGSGDGLLIIDSITGEALAERIEQAEEWRRFRLVRVAPRAGSMVVTFALSGLGEAWLDDVAVQAVDQVGSDNVAASRAAAANGGRR